MKLRRLRVQNLKLLEDQVFDFVHEGEVRGWTAILGENGLCKTSILQAVALATSGERMAYGLSEGDVGDLRFAGTGSQPLRIEAELETRDGLKRVVLRADAKASALSGEGDVGFFDEVRDRRESGYFVVGYGVGRRLPKRGEVAVPKSPHFERVKGLFDTHHKVLGTDFFAALRDEPDLKESKLELRYAEVLGEVLQRVLPDLVQFERRGKGGVRDMAKLLESRRFRVRHEGGELLALAPHQLSQGYQSMLAWIADLLGHAFLDRRAAVSPAELEGIVLLDEIDLHLHPRWQRVVVPTLREVFPRVQFLVTTHSPLVLTGLDAHEIVKLEVEEGRVVQRRFSEEPGLQSTNELMEHFFDVPVAGREELLEKERQLLALEARPRLSQKAALDLERLKAELQPYRAATAIPTSDAPSRPDLDDLRRVVALAKRLGLEELLPEEERNVEVK